MTQTPSPKSLPKDYFRYLSIICVLFLTLLCLSFISSWKDSSFHQSVEDPWQPSDGIFSALGALGFFLSIYVLLILTVACSLFLTLFTVLNYLSHEPTYRKKRYYYITLVLGCVLLILMIGIPIGTQIRTTTIQNSFTDLIPQEDIDLTPNLNIVNNSPVQALGSYSFQCDLTYMYVIVVEDQPLPSKEFELVELELTFILNEPIIGITSLYEKIRPWNLRYNVEPKEIVIDKNYYYIVTNYRLFVDEHISTESTINCNLTCSVNRFDTTTNRSDFQVKLIFLEDHSDTIRKGTAELSIIKYDPIYAFWLGISSILVILISLVNIFKYPDLKSS